MNTDNQYIVPTSGNPLRYKLLFFTNTETDTLTD